MLVAAATMVAGGAGEEANITGLAVCLNTVNVQSVYVVAGAHNELLAYTTVTSSLFVNS